jgi:hypothetical protein
VDNAMNRQILAWVIAAGAVVVVILYSINPALFNERKIVIKLPSISLQGNVNENQLGAFLIFSAFGALGGFVSAMFELASAEDKDDGHKKTITKRYWMVCGAGAGALGGIFASDSGSGLTLKAIGISFAAGIAWRGIIPQAMNYASGQPPSAPSKEVTASRFNALIEIAKVKPQYNGQPRALPDIEAVFADGAKRAAIASALPSSFTPTPQKFNFSYYRSLPPANRSTGFNQIGDGLKALLVNVLKSNGQNVDLNTKTDDLFSISHSLVGDVMAGITTNIETLHGLAMSAYVGDVVIGDAQYRQFIDAVIVTAAQTLFYLAMKSSTDTSYQPLKTVLDTYFQ